MMQEQELFMWSQFSAEKDAASNLFVGQQGILQISSRLIEATGKE
jgi:hypothetical protein